MITIAMLVVLTGCTYIGSLSETEEKAVENYLISQGIVDEIIGRDTIGAGEGEVITYIFDLKKGNDRYQLKMQQRQICEDYRIFELYENGYLDEDAIFLKITSDGEVSIAEE